MYVCGIVSGANGRDESYRYVCLSLSGTEGICFWVNIFFLCVSNPSSETEEIEDALERANRRETERERERESLSGMILNTKQNRPWENIWYTYPNTHTYTYSYTYIHIIINWQVIGEVSVRERAKVAELRAVIQSDFCQVYSCLKLWFYHWSIITTFYVYVPVWHMHPIDRFTKVFTQPTHANRQTHKYTHACSRTPARWGSLVNIYPLSHMHTYKFGTDVGFCWITLTHS